MTLKQDQKEETRRRMVQAASQSFRSHGYAGIGVDGIAKAANVTSGAFYAHFGSKDGAFAAALDVGLDEVIDAMPKFQEKGGTEWIKNFADYYLGRAHREDLACGCAMTTLSPEVVRTKPETHGAYEAKMTKIVALFAKGLEGGSEEERQSRAWASLSAMIGGLTMARAVKTRKTAEQIAAAAHSTAIIAAGKVR